MIIIHYKKNYLVSCNLLTSHDERTYLSVATTKTQCQTCVLRFYANISKGKFLLSTKREFFEFMLTDTKCPETESEE